jgi:hypothetical protein
VTTPVVRSDYKPVVKSDYPIYKDIYKDNIKDNKDNSEIITTTGDVIKLNTGGGKWEVNELREYFLKVFQLPKEDGTQTDSRKYWWNLLRQFGMSVQRVKSLIDLAYKDEFYRNNITSSKDLWFKQVKLMARARGTVPKIVSMPQEQPIIAKQQIEGISK